MNGHKLTESENWSTELSLSQEDDGEGQIEDTQTMVMGHRHWWRELYAWNAIINSILSHSIIKKTFYFFINKRGHLCKQYWRGLSWKNH